MTICWVMEFMYNNRNKLYRDLQLSLSAQPEGCCNVPLLYPTPLILNQALHNYFLGTESLQRGEA